MRQGLENRFKKPKGWLWGHFNNARGGRLRFGRLAHHKTPLAHILYVEGLSEPAERTFELARDFNNMACNFSVLDRHGQGKSTRYLPDREKQHSQGVEHDIDDLIHYVDQHIPAGEPVILLGHSTGGLLAMLALEKAPERFKAAILIAPLFGLAPSPGRDREALLARLPTPELLTQCYMPGGTGWKARSAPDSTVRPEDFSSDPVRNKLADYWNNRDKDLRTGAPTFGWVIEMCKAIMRTRKPDFANKMDRLNRPVLIFTAGQDQLVNNRYTEDLAARLRDAKLYHFPDGKHELLQETDAIRRPLLQHAHDFLKNIL